MRTSAKFCKVSIEQYVTATGSEQYYDDIKLPCRATMYSAGYDFFAPQQLHLEAGQSVTVATGIRALMPHSWVLLIVPRSGLGFKYRIRLSNTVGVIDADYANSANEGHIFVKLTNEGEHPVDIAQGSAFAQGIFTNYCLTEDDHVDTIRDGGIGSTN